MAMMIRTKNPLYNEFNNSDYALALDVIEREDAYTVVAALPGVNPDDIHIRLHDDVLSISGATNAPQINEGERAVLRERRYGTYSRSLRFRTPVDGDNIDANYENGMLTLSVPKAASAQPRRIPVTVAHNGNGNA